VHFLPQGDPSSEQPGNHSTENCLHISKEKILLWLFQTGERKKLKKKKKSACTHIKEKEELKRTLYMCIHIHTLAIKNMGVLSS